MWLNLSFNDDSHPEIHREKAFETELMNWLQVRVVNRHLKKVSMLECQLYWGALGLLWVCFYIWSSSTWAAELEYV